MINKTIAWIKYIISKTIVTLDISDSHIKLLVVKGKRVKVAASITLEPGLVKFGVIEDTGAVGEKIIELMSTHRVRGRKVDICISGIYSIFRIITLPVLSGNQLSNAVRQEMARLIAAPINEVYISWQTLHTTYSGMTVGAVAIPTNTCDALLATVKQAGLKSQFVTIRPMAIARMVDERDAIAVNVQPAEYDITVIVNGVPELLRSVPFPSGDIPEAQRMAMVIEDLEKTISFYNASHNQDIITGDTAIFINGEMGELLLETIPFRVKQLPELLSGPSSFTAAHYASNVSLVLKKPEDYDSPVQLAMNIIPQAYLPKSQMRTILTWGAVGTALVIIALFGFVTSQETTETASLRTQVNAAQAKLLKFQWDEQDMRELAIRFNNLEATSLNYTLPLESAREQREKINEDLDDATMLLPPLVNLELIKCGERLILAGTSPDMNSIKSYVQTLLDGDRFSNTVRFDMEEVETDKWSFALELE